MIVRPLVVNTTASSVDRRAAEPHRHRRADRVGHLRGEGALPDQLVEPELVGLDSWPATSPGVRNVSPAGRIASCASCAFFTLRV